MQQQFTLPVPPSTNNLFATYAGRRYATSAYLKWRRETGWMLKAAGAKTVPGRVKVVIAVPQSRHRRDLDNYAKPLLDLLVKQRVIPDDSDLIVREISIAIDTDLVTDQCVVTVISCQ